MYIEFYYFPFILEKKYKIDTLLDSLIFDLKKFFLYYFDEKLEKKGNYYLGKDVKIFFLKNSEIYIPNFIFQYKGNLTKFQINELIEIFSSYGEEKFIINYDSFNLNNKSFLELDNVESFLNKANIYFSDFIEKYKKNKLIDETEKDYKVFRKLYSLFLYLNYILLKTYRNIRGENNKLKNMETSIKEYTAHIELLKNRLNLDEKTLEKTIVTYQNFIEKLMKILKSFDN